MKKYWSYNQYESQIDRLLSEKKIMEAVQSYMLLLSLSLNYSNNIEKKILEVSIDTNTDAVNHKIAVSSWDFSHNAVGRAITLFDLYQYAQYDVDLIGCMIQNKKNHKKIWQPLNDSQIIYNFFEINQSDIDKLLPKAIDFVIKNPYDIVHLSKPRITNIILGILYRHIWGAKIILDIDDEELAFLKEKKTNFEYSNNIKDDYWTNYSVSLYDIFDAITVSNPALQHKYGGIIIPHIRNEKLFYPNQTLKIQNREKYGIKQTDKVILFFGTPKSHKGLLETAKAILQLNCSDLLFLIVGDFSEIALKNELLAIDNVRYMFLPDQPYDQAKNIVVMGDICVLMQDESSEIAKYQLPAKLIDALAMGLTIFMQKTPATEFISAPNLYFVNQEKLSESLNCFLWQNKNNLQASQYQYFLQNFSTKKYEPIINKVIENLNSVPYNFEKSFDFIRELANISDVRIFLERFGKK